MRILLIVLATMLAYGILYYLMILFYLVVESTGYYKKIDKVERKWLR